MTVNHKDLTTTALHEPNGAHSASASNVYVANGSGSGTWQKISTSEIGTSFKNTNKIIWKYLASVNLLYNIDEVEIDDFDKISLIEKATNDKNYSENDLFEIYKKFQFNINQLINASEVYKSLTNVEAKALIYQKILSESETTNKLQLIKILKDLFIKDN